MRTDAYEIVGAAAEGGVLFTAEHASNRVPRPWRPSPSDRVLLGTHWGYDIGARALTLEIARLASGVAVCSRFSRLLIDPNRAEDDPSAILHATDDGAPTFNRSVVVAERVARFHAPFHAAIDSQVRAARPRFLVSIHSFTPVFRGVQRQVEAGVLFDDHDDHAEVLVRSLRAEGLRTEPNEPYSGKAGLIYSARRHGTTHGVPYLEIEVRQDLLATRAAARRMAQRVWRALRTVVG